MKIIKCDVLIVGGGGAALRAAIAAKEYKPDAHVVVATKGMLGKSGVTAVSCSDRMAFHATLEHTEPGGTDAWKYHADDIYRIGGKVSDYKLAEILARNAKTAFHYLDGLGVPFVKKNGLADQFVTDGSEYARACYTGPKTAVHIEEALLRRFAQINIPVYHFTAVHKLVLDEGRIVGAIAVNTQEKDREKAVFAFAAPAVILATGGGGLIYEHNVFPGGMTGDGFAMAYEAGAEIVNMEFIQIGIASTKTKFNCSGSMMRAIPRLVNDLGEEILPKYFAPGTSPAEIYNTLFKKGASWPVSYEHKTHIIDIALYKEWHEGRKVYLDYSRNPTGFSFDLLDAEIIRRYESEMRVDLGAEKRANSPLYRLMEINQASIDWFLERDVDIANGERIEVAACAQHFQGGIKIDEYGRTTIPGLWAAGETAGGQHGANRPGGNALMDCQVFGKIAGEDAISVAGNVLANMAVIESQLESFVEKIKRYDNGMAAAELRRRIQAIMQQYASIIRTEEGLKDGLARLRQFKNLPVAMDHNGLNYLLETLGMIDVAEMVLTAAIKRDESRGPHMRFEMFTDNIPVSRKDGAWDQYIVMCKGKNGPVIDIRQPDTGH